jgi:tetratricopeptide (TPR) repeat protein
MALSLLALLYIRRRPYLFVGWFWFLGCLVPVSGIMQAGMWPAMADRFAYLPFVGLYLLVVWSFGELADRKIIRRSIIVCVTSTTIVALAIVSRQYVGHWQNSLALFTRAVRVTADNYLAHNNLGNVYFRKGNYPLAEYHYRESQKINPGYSLSYANYGALYLKIGNLEKAIQQFDQALLLDPGLTYIGKYRSYALSALEEDQNDAVPPPAVLRDEMQEFQRSP